MQSRDSVAIEQLAGLVVVVDLSSPFVCLGRLVAQQRDWLLLEEADLHDLRDTQTTREKYILQAREHGPGTNRHRVWLSLREVVAISPLDDVISY